MSKDEKGHGSNKRFESGRFGGSGMKKDERDHQGHRMQFGLPIHVAGVGNEHSKCKICGKPMVKNKPRLDSGTALRERMELD